MEKCECTKKRDVQVMDYDENTGTCLTCYRQVDLTPDKDVPSFFQPGGQAINHKINFIGKYKFPVHHKPVNDADLFVINSCPYCEAEERAQRAEEAEEEGPRS